MPEDRSSSSINTNSDFKNVLQKYGQSRYILRSLGKLGKRTGTASLLKSARLSVRMEQRDFHWTDLLEISYLEFH